MKTQILFNGKHHTYTTGKKIQYSSVSTLVGKFKQPFDGEYWSKYKAYEKLLATAKLRELRKEGRFELGDSNLFPWLNNFVDPKEAAKEIKAVLKDWKHEKDKSIIKGNNYHEFKEKQSIEMGYVINPFTGIKFNTVESTIVEVKKGIEYRKPAFDSLKDLQDGYHPELILWNNKYKLAGQADRIFVETINGLKYISVDDFKTSKVIKTTNGYWKHDKETGKKSFVGSYMLPPLDHLQDCNLNHYKLQICTYAWMLEQEGYIVKDLAFTHLNEMYRFAYMKEEVEAMLGVIPEDKDYLNMI
jgi:hypothetical protein